MTIRHLQVVIPDALAQLRTLSEQVKPLSAFPVLEHCLHFGLKAQLWQADDLSHARVDAWQQSLLYALPRECRHHGAASARLTWLGEEGDARSGSCFQVMPVHFQVGLDDVRYLLPPPLSSVEADAIFESMKPLLASAGFDLLQASSEAGANWYLWCDRELKINTFSLHNLSNSRLFNLMPQGADAGELRRLITELQMLLHEHPVNQQRERRGLLPVNAFWFHGHAPVKAVSCSNKSLVMSHSPYVRGLCYGLNLECLTLPNDVRTLPNMNAEQVLLVLPSISLQSVEKEWLKELYAVLLKGHIDQLDMHLDNWQITLYGGRWSQWRRLFRGKQQEMKDFFS